MRKRFLLAAMVGAVIASCSPHHDSTNSSTNGAAAASSNGVVDSSDQQPADGKMQTNPPSTPPMNNVADKLDVQVLKPAVPHYGADSMTLDIHKAIQVKSKTNSITINKVVVNDGACEFSYGDEPPVTLNDGDFHSYNLGDVDSCSVSKVRVETDRGNAEFDFDNK